MTCRGNSVQVFKGRGRVSAKLKRKWNHTEQKWWLPALIETIKSTQSVTDVPRWAFGDGGVASWVDECDLCSCRPAQWTADTSWITSMIQWVYLIMGDTGQFTFMANNAPPQQGVISSWSPGIKLLKKEKSPHQFLRQFWWPFLVSLFLSEKWPIAWRSGEF